MRERDQLCESLPIAEALDRSETQGLALNLVPFWQHEIGITAKFQKHEEESVSS